MKPLQQVKEEIQKILDENDCRIMSLYNFEQEQDNACLIRKKGLNIIEQVDIE
jgi:hypothetical protein